MAVRTRNWPGIVIAVIALVAMTAVTIGWNVIFPVHFQLAFTPEDPTGMKVGYWIIMAVGDLFLIFVMTGLSLLLAMAIRRNKALRSQNAFIDSISHELKTPIASLRLQLDTLSRREMDAPKRHDFLQRMRGDLDRLQDQVEMVLQASRMEHGERARKYEAVELCPLLESSRLRICERYRIDEDAIRVDCPAEACVVGDTTAVCTVIDNLLDNACKYSRDKPYVTVTVRPHHRRWQLWIRDRGVGIHPEERTRVFKRFKRGDRSEQISSVPGSGLGLYLVRELTRQMGGSVQVEDTDDEIGTLMVLELPRRMETAHEP